MVNRYAFVIVCAALLAVAGANSALADIAKPWQILFQEPASPVMEKIVEFNNFISVIIVLITMFVLALLFYVVIKFNEKTNPNPAKTTHNTALEVIWTAIPILILVAIGIPSLKLLYYQDRHHTPDMTIKVTGNQWYWTYQFPDHGGFSFDSMPIPAEDLKPGQLRLLSVNNELVLPIATNIRVLQTSKDVIHAWAIPAFGLKVDAVPGRINENWVRITAEGTYYGQCMELCGVNHYFMPIAVKAVSKEAFARWVEDAKKKFAANPEPSTVRLAEAR